MAIAGMLYGKPIDKTSMNNIKMNLGKCDVKNLTDITDNSAALV
jgi:hypothetical protein